MSARNKLILLFVILCILILISFLIWGAGFEALFSLQGSQRFFEAHRDWAGPLGAGLLVADLILPIPSTGVLGGMGAVLGVRTAFLWGWSGLVLSGICGYAAARLGGTHWAEKLASEAERERYRSLFNHWGSLAIILTRLLPILPEVLSVLSGLYGMKFSRFIGATLLGSLAPAFAYAWLGAQAREHPGPAVWGIVLLTALAWLAFLRLQRATRTP